MLADNYEDNFGLWLGDNYVELTRGFVIVDAIIKGDIFRFVNIHLEVRSYEGSIFRLFQGWQMGELLETIDRLSDNDHSWKHIFNPKAVIMLGDFNSSIEDEPGDSWYIDENGSVLLPYTPPYMQAIEAGYLDAWLEQPNYDEGYTSGFDDFIDDPTDELDTRIDIVFLDPLDLEINKVRCKVVGDHKSDMVPNPQPYDPKLRLWPSDHAGGVAKIKFSERHWPWWKKFRWHPK